MGLVSGGDRDSCAVSFNNLLARYLELPTTYFVHVLCCERVVVWAELINRFHG